MLNKMKLNMEIPMAAIDIESIPQVNTPRTSVEENHILTYRSTRLFSLKGRAEAACYMIAD